MVVESEASLRQALVDRSVPKPAEVSTLNHIRHGRGGERSVVLTEESKASQFLGKAPVNASPGQAYRRLAGTNRRYVSIADPGKVTFEIEFKAASDDCFWSRIKPLEIRT